jgi:hypothetical protein
MLLATFGILLGAGLYTLSRKMVKSNVKQRDRKTSDVIDKELRR